jgi:hypothetical protein
MYMYVQSMESGKVKVGGEMLLKYELNHLVK